MAGIFHEGELAVQALAGEAARAERNGNLVTSRIMAGALTFLEKQSMAVMAYVDRENRIWTSILFGRPGFLRSEDGLAVKINTSSIAKQPHDPLWESIGSGTPAGMLVIELASRRRIRINGDLAQLDEHWLQLAVRESYPNCPKFITRRGLRTLTIDPAPAQIFAQGKELGTKQIATAGSADVFFIGTVHPERGLDASHRGGPPGFVEVLNGHTLRIPDYLGNSMFNTLGNLAIDKRAGVIIPDFARGVELRMSGRAEALWNQPDDKNVSGGTHRFIVFSVERWNEEPLPPGVHSEFFDYSPFNPIAAAYAALAP